MAFVEKKSDINDFKTYSLGNFKNPAVLFMTASFASSIISGSFFLVLIQQSYHTGIAYVLKKILFDPLSYAITAFFVLPLHKNTKNGGDVKWVNGWKVSF